MVQKQTNDASVRMASNNTAPVLNYNVPEPTTYSGRTYIELDIADNCFLPPQTGTQTMAAFGAAAMSFQAAAAPQQLPIEELRKVKRSGDRMTTRLAELTEEEVEQQAREGKKLSLFRTMTGAWSHRFAADAAAAAPEYSEPEAFRAALAPLPTTEDPYQSPPIVDVDVIDEQMRDDDDWPPEEDPIEESVTATITAPAANTNITGPHTGAVIEIRGTATAVLGTVSRVMVKAGTGAWKQAQLSGNNWVLSGVVITDQGQVTLQADAYHSNGLLSYITSRKINVALEQAPDVTPPTVTITSPAAGAVLATNNGPAANITVQGTAGDNRGVTRVELLLDGQNPVAVDTPNNYATWSKALSIPAGNHSITARCYDAAGLRGESSLNVSVDTTAPTISITSPALNAAIAGTYTKGAVIEVFGSASDGGGVKVVEVSLNNSPVYVRAVEKAPGDWSQWKATVKVDLPGLCVIKARATDMSGNTMEAGTQVNVTILPEVSSRKNRIILIESYRLSSFLANYGAGRTLKTFSLLPGEKSKISIRTYAQKEETMKSASTILDSVTDDIASEFELSIGDETSNKTGYESSNDYKLEASVGVSWGGWLNASASASTSGATNAAREQLTKNIVNSTQKHVSKASARRDMQIDTTYEVKTTTTDETSIVREIENINMSRTLNFVFRQMNQEFITLLHLVDVRIGFYRDEKIEGQGNSYYQEVTLPELNKLLAEIIVPEKREEIRNTIMFQLMNIFDYQDIHHSFVEEAVLRDANGNVIPASNYLRVRKDHYSEYADEATGTTIKVPGIIMAANKHVLRTDGIVVDAVLGQGEALDEYSSNLQLQSVREKELKNDLLQTEVRMRELALQILESKDQAAAQLYALLNPQPVASEEEEEAAVTV